MDSIVLRKVVLRVPGTTRLRWAIILAQREGLSLLFSKSADADGKTPHNLVFAVENPREHCFDSVNANQFPLKGPDLMLIGRNLLAVSEHLQSEEFNNLFFEPDDWWRDS